MTEKKDLVLEILGIIQDQLVTQTDEMRELRVEVVAVRSEVAVLRGEVTAMRAQMARMDQRITTFTLSHRVDSAKRFADIEARLARLEQADSDP